MIATNVKRYRLLMLPAVLEKPSFGLATVILYGNDRPSVAGAGAIDQVLAVLFALTFRSTDGEGV